MKQLNLLMQATIIATMLALVMATVAHADVRDIPQFVKSDYIYAAKSQEWKHGIQRGLLVAVCDQETRFRPHEVSNKGAIGLCQIMPDTFTDIVKRIQVANGLVVDGIMGPNTWEAFRPGTKYRRMSDSHRLLDPFQNVEFAALLLRHIKTTVSADPVIMFGVYFAGQRHQVVRYQLEVQARWRGGI